VRFDGQEHTFDIPPDLAVFKSQSSNSKLRQKRASLEIIRLCGFVIVCRTVKLHRKLFGGTIEIENVWTDAVLPTKFPSA